MHGWHASECVKWFVPSAHEVWLLISEVTRVCGKDRTSTDSYTERAASTIELRIASTSQTWSRVLCTGSGMRSDDRCNRACRLPAPLSATARHLAKMTSTSECMCVTVTEFHAVTTALVSRADNDGQYNTISTA